MAVIVRDSSSWITSSSSFGTGLMSASWVFIIVFFAMPSTTVCVLLDSSFFRFPCGNHIDLKMPWPWRRIVNSRLRFSVCRMHSNRLPRCLLACSSGWCSFDAGLPSIKIQHSRNGKDRVFLGGRSGAVTAAVNVHFWQSFFRQCSRSVRRFAACSAK